MLTKDLIRHKIDGGNIHPQFINPAGAALLDLASGLLELFKSAEGWTRSELLETAQAVRESSKVPQLIARGLEKLLLDRSDFDGSDNDQLIEFRAAMFSHSSALLQADGPVLLDDYLQTLEKHSGRPLEEVRSLLYSDLPEFQQLLRFRALSPERLLHRYNAAQVQGLLIHSEKLTITLRESGSASLRQLFKYLRFRQLLADIRKTGDAYEIVIDGPLSLFYQTRKYGLNLAMFFPALLEQEQWHLEALVRTGRNRGYRLQLDHSSVLRSWGGHFLAYIPEEIKALETSFNQLDSHWQLRPAETFFPLPGDRYCFPDYELVHSGKKTLPLELFHAWHASHLQSRLAVLEKSMPSPLLLGVATRLQKDTTIAAQLEQSDYFRQYGFTFRDIPAASRLLKLLESLD